MDFTYSFVDASGHNNGNVAQITDNQAWPLTQTFIYDSLNRVATAQSLGTHSSAPGTCWAETYNYDAWGNLYAFGANSTTQSAYIGCSQESGLSSSPTTKNQLSTYTYDAAGNLITIPGVANYTYDAENHLVSAGGLNYSYDGDGKRVMKSNGTLYWYGAGSDPLFESDTSGYQIFKHFYFNGMRVARQEGWSHGYWIDHYVNDALGSARFVYGYNGAWDVSDYYPFGGERPYQSQEGNVFKFTGKERDSESGLDNFGARYYSNSMGRFMSPDWAATATAVPYADFGNPQSLNLYGYVKNNPLNLTDPDGHCDDNDWCGSVKGVAFGTWNFVKNTAITAYQTAKEAADSGSELGAAATALKQATQTLESIGYAADQYSTKGVSGVANDVLAQGTEGATEIMTEAILTGGLVATSRVDSVAPSAQVPESIPAGPSSRPTAAQQNAINEMGEAHGCHTCGATTPGTKSGNWVGDHQPSTALNPPRGSQVYKPQCLRCSRQQGGQVAAALKASKKKQEQPQ